MRLSSRLLLVPILSAFSTCPGRADDLRSATVTQTYNDVKLIEPEKADQPAESGARIAGQRGVRTGQQSRAELEFQDKTLTRLGANTIFSFEGGTRSMEMQQGTMLLQVPKNAGGAKIRTAAVTAAITGTTILLEYTPDRIVTEGGKKKKKKGSIKVIVLEGTLKLSLNNGSNQTVTLNAGQMLVTDPNTVQLPGAVTVDLGRIVETSLLVNNSFWGQAGITGRTGTPDPQGRPARLSMALIDPEVEKQREAIVAGTLTDVNLSTSPYGSDVQTLQLNVTFQLDTRFSVQTESVAPPAPDKFGALPDVAPGVYAVDSASIFVLDPVVTGPGGTVEGRIYRGNALDGAPTNYLFGQAASAFDTSVGFNSDAYFNVGSGFPANGVTVFRFTGLNVTGSPTFQTAGGVYTDLALATTGNANVGGSAAFTLNLSPLTSFGLVTQNGSIALASNVTVSGTPATLVNFLARGASGSLQSDATINNVARVRLAAETNLTVGGSLSAATSLQFVAGGNATINAALAAPSLSFAAQAGTLTLSPGGIATTGLTSLTASGRTINLTGSFDAGTSASTIVFNAGAGGFNAVGFTLGGANRQISVNVTDGGAFNAQNFFGNSLVLTGGGAINVPGTLDVATLTTTGPLNVGTLNARNSLSLGSVTAGSIGLGGAGANFSASGNVVTDALSVPGTLTIGGFLRTAGVLPAAQRIVTAGGDITIAGDAGNPAGFPGDHYRSFTSTGGNIAVGTAANGLTLYADTISAAGSVRAGGVISDRITAGAGGIQSTTAAIRSGVLSTPGAVLAATDLVFDSTAVGAYTLTSGSLSVGRDLQFDATRTLTLTTGVASLGGRLIGVGSAGQAGGSLTINATSLTLVAPSSGALIDLRGGAASGVGGAGGQLSLDLSGTGTFLLPTGNVTLAGGSGATGGAGGRFELRTAGSVDLLGSLDLRGGSGTTAGVGGSVAIAATGDLLVGGAILTTGSGIGGDGSVTLSSSAGSIVLNSSIATGGMNFQAAVDLQLQAGAAIVGNGPIALSAGRDLIGSGGSIFTTDYDVTLAVGRDLSVGFFGGRLITVGRNVGIGQLSFENATIGGSLTATTLLPYQPAGSTNVANVYRLEAGSVEATNLFFAAAAGSTSARTLQLNTAGGSILLGGFADFSGGRAASGQAGDGGSLFVNVPGGSGVAGAVTLGSGFFFIARGADSTVDELFSGGRGGTLRLFAAGNLVLGGAGDPVIDVRGGNADTLANGRGGSGGFVEVETTGDLTVANGIAAGTGVNGPLAGGRPNGGIVVGGGAAGTGGTVNLTAGGSLTVGGNIEVSAPDALPSGSPTPPPQAASLNGGNVNLTATNGDLTLTNGADIVAGISDLAQSLGGVAGTVNLSAPNGSLLLDNGSIHNRYGTINLSAPNGTLALGLVDLLGATINFNGLAITIAIETNPPQGALHFVAGSGGITAQPTIGNADLPTLTTIDSVGTITVVSGGIFANYVRATGTNSDILARDGVLAVDGNIEAARDIVLGTFGSGRLSVANGNIVAGRDIVAPDGIYTGGDPFTVTAWRDITTGSLLSGTVTVGRDLLVTDSGTGAFITVNANTLNVPGVLRLTNVSFVGYNNAVLGADVAGTPVPFTLNAGSIVTSGFVPTLLFAGEAAGFYSNPGSGGSVNLTTSGALDISADGQFADLFAHGGDSIVGTTTGGDGGQVRLVSGAGGFTLGLGSSIRATTGSIFLGGPNALGQGGLVDVVTAGPVAVNGVIETSLDDDPMAGFSVRTTSLSGGSIALRTSLTSGPGIALGDGAELRADVLAGNPGGSISLTTGGADVNLGAARVTARGGVINIEAPNATVSLAGSFLQAQQLNLNATSGAPATLTGYGTIAANYANAVTIRPGLGGASTGLAFAGNLTLLGSSQLQFQLGGLVQGSQYGFIGVSGATTLGGQLVLSFVNGFDTGVANTDTFTLLTSSSPFVGAFTNIASGGRYNLPNGSFLVTYAGNTLVLSDFQLAATALAIWDNSANNWSSGANWSTAPVFPNGNYSARIGGGSVNLDGAFSVVALQLYGGALGGTGSVDATDVTFRADSGGANFTGGLLTASNGVVLESTAGSGTLGAISGNALLVNAGPAGAFFGVSGGRGFAGSDSAILRNAPGATFTVSGDNDAGFVRLGGLPVFDNQGRFVRDSGSGLFGIEWAFDNRGEVEVESGTLGLGLGGTSSGEWRIDASATLHLAAGTFVFNNGSQVTGGSVLFTGDVLTLGGATTGDAGWTFSGGTVGGSGSLTAGSLTFLRQAGTATDVAAGTLTATNGVRFVSGSDAAAAATFSGTALVISQGTGSFSGASNGDFVAGRDNAIFRNDLGATFTADVSNAQAFRLLSGTPTLDNRGTFVTDAGTTGAFGVEWSFLNSGAVQVNSGKLLLAGGGSSTGSFGIASGALLAFTGGTYRLDPGTSFSGAGGVTLTGGTLTLGGAIGGSASLLLAGGDLNGPAGSWSLATLFFQRGATGATNVGSGTLTASNGIVLAAGAGVAPLGTLSGSAVVINTGNGVFFGSANGDFLVGRDNAVFRNAPGATFDAQIDHNQAFLYGGGNPVFDNQGTFLRSVATGSFVLDWTFQNSGNVSVESGQLVFDRGGSATASSSFDVLAGASLAFANGNFALAGGTVLGGAGSYSLGGGTLDLAGAIAGTPNFVLQGGALTGSGSLTLGTLTVQRGAGGGTIVNGPTLTAAGGVLFQAGATGAALGELTGNTVLINAGPGSFGGAAGGDFLVGSGNAIFRNATGATLDAQADNAQAFASGTGTPRFENQGTFNRTTGTGTFGVQWAFANTGTVNVQSGTLAFSGGFQQSGASAILNLVGGNVSSPSALDLQSGTLTGFGGINAAILNNAFIRPGLAGAGLSVNGNVTLLAGSQLQFQLGGLTQGSQYGFVGVNGSVQLGGQLVLSFANGFQSGVANANTFTLLTSSSALSGAFANIASGSRLNTADGFGSFLVTYSGNALVLSGFLPPTTPNAVWDGGSNVWSSAANWSTNPSFPNGAFNATVNSGTVTLDGAYSVLQFTLNGGTLAGASTLTANSGFAWNGGTIAAGTVVSASGVNLAGATLKTLGGIVTNGLTFTGGDASTASSWTFTAGGAFNNAGTFVASTDTSVGGAGGTFNNSGTFRRNGGTGTYAIDGAAFNNSGTVEVLSGTLALNAGGGSNGTFRAGSGATLSFAGAHTMNAGAFFTGAGAFSISGGTFTLAGATTGDAGSITLAGGTLNGSGSLSTTGAFTFAGGTLAASVSAAGVQITGGAVKALNGTLTNAVGATGGDASTASSWSFGTGGVFNNAGTFVATTDTTVGGASGTINNSGTFQRTTGAGTYAINGAAFNNSGTAEVQSGTLALTGGGISSGVFRAGAGATLSFGANYAANAGTNFTGAGQVVVSGGALALGGAISSDVAQFTLNGGSLSGSGSLSTTGVFTFASGTLAGTVSAAGVQLTGAAVKALNGTLTNAVGATGGDASTASSWIFGTGGAFNNAGTFAATTDTTVGGTGGTINNSGTFQRTTGGGTYAINGAAFSNSGTAEVLSGTLSLAGGGASSGLFRAGAGATLSFGANYAANAGTSFTGAGQVLVSGGALTLGGALSSDVAQFTLAGGSMSGSGSLSTTGAFAFAGGTLGASVSAAGVQITGAAVKALNGTLTNAVGATGGDASTASSWSFGAGGVFNNAGTFVASTDTTIGGTGGTITNSGTFNRTTGTGIYAINGASFANSGTVNAQSGTLAFNGGYTQSAGALNLAGGNVAGSTLTFNGGLLGGAGAIAADVVNNATLRPALAGGGLALTGNLTLLASSQLQFQLGGLTQGSQYGFLGVNGSVALGGQLVLTFANGFQSTVGGTDTFTLLTTSSAFSGAFSNIASGSRLNTADGFGSFLVTYSGASLVLSAFQLPAAANAVWDGSSNNWSSGANWSTSPSFPNGNFNATINAGTVTLDGNYAVQAFNLTGGTLTGATTLTVNNLFTWSGGVIGGGAGLLANGGIAVSGAATRQLDAATLFVPVGTTATDSGGHLFLLSNSAVISNAGTWNATGPAGGMSFTIGGTNVFNNSGAFVRNGTGDYTFGSVQFNNTGTVNLVAGNLQLNGGGSSTGGSFTLAAGTILRVNTTYTFDAASSIAGAGAVNFTNFTGIAVGGTYNVTGGTLLAGAGVTFDTDASTSTLQLNGTTLALGVGRTFTASGLFTWRSGTLTGGTLQANGGALLGNASALALAGTTLNVPVGQTLTDSGNHTLTISGGSILNLAGTFLARNNTGLTNSGGSNAINNSGTFTRDGTTGAYTVSVPFNNTGTTEALTGTLVLSGGGSSSGVFRAGAGAGLVFGTNYAANAGTSFTGAGSVTITGGTFALGGALSSDVAQFSLTLGTLGGSGSLSTTGVFGFSGGTLAANVTAAGVQISGGTGKTLAGTLTNAVGATGSDTSTGGSFSLAVGAVFNNAGTFGVSGTTAIAGTGGTINNSGTFERTGTGTYTIAGAGFVNSGTVNVTGGTLAFNGGYTQTAGTLNLNGGNVAGSTLGIDGGVLTGAGAIAAALANNAVLRPGLGGAGLAVTGSVSLLGASQLQFQLGGLTQGSQYGFLSVNGALSLGGQLVVSFANNFQNTVSGTDTFTLALASAGLSGAFANIATGSRLNTADGFGSFLVTYGGTSIVLSGYQVNVAEALWLGGAGNWSDAPQWSTNPVFPNGLIDARINGGSVRLDAGTYAVRNFTLAGGDLNTAGGRPNAPTAPAGGPPALGVTGLFTWTGGTLLNVGITAQNGVVLSGTGPLLLDGGYINHGGGTFLDTGAHNWTLANGSILNLAAPFFARNDSGILNSGTGNQINNQSVFTREVGTGTYAIAPFFFNDGGTINAATGTLSLSGGLTNDGALNVAAGASVRIGASFGSNGSITLAGGSLLLDAANSTVSQIAGTSGTVALGLGSTLSLPGGFNFRGVGGSTPMAGGTLLFTGSGMVFGSSTGQIGASFFSGGDASTPGAGGDGGSFTVVSGSTLTLGSGADLNASNGAGNSVAFGGSGGSITLRATGVIGLGGNVKVSSTTAGFASANGGTLLVHSDALTGTGIALAAGATLNGGISPAAFGAGGVGGSITLETTGASTIDLQGVINAPNATVNINPGGGLTLASGTINNAGGRLNLTVGGALSLSGTNLVTDTLTATATSIFIDPTRPFPLLSATAPFSSLTATAGSITGGFANSPNGFLSLFAPAGGIALTTGLNNAFTIQARDNVSATGVLNAFSVTSLTGSISAPSLGAGTVSAATALSTNSLAADQVTAGSATLNGNVNVRVLTVSGALDLTGANVAPAPNNGTPGVHDYTFGSLVGLPNAVVFSGLVGSDPNNAGSGGTLNLIQTGTASLTIGGVAVNGAATSATPTGGSNGGRFTVDTPGAFTLVGNINALSGQIPAAGPDFFGAGGSVSIRSGGALSVTQPIFTSLAQPTGLPHVQSASGGSIALTSSAGISVTADLAAGVSDAAFLAGGAGGSIVLRAANTFGITLAGITLDAQNGLLDLGYTSGAGPVVFGTAGLTRLGARSLTVSGLSLDFSSTQLIVTGAGVFNIGSGGVSGNAFFGLTSGGGTLTLNSAGPINLPAGIAVTSALSAPSIATGSLSAPSITTTSGDLSASGTIISDTVTVAGVFALNSGFNVFNAYTAPNAQGTPAPVSFFAGQYNAPSLQFDLNGVVGTNPNFAGDGGQLDLRSTTAGLPMFVASIIHNLNASGAPTSAAPVGGSNGGNIRLESAGDLNIGGPIVATTGLLPSVGPDFFGTGGTVQVFAAGTISLSGFNPGIRVSSSEGPGPAHTSSRNGGIISLQSMLTTGRAIDALNLVAPLSNAALLAGGTPSSVNLTTPGGDIYLRGADVTNGTLTLSVGGPSGTVFLPAPNAIAAGTFNITAGALNISTIFTPTVTGTATWNIAAGGITADVIGLNGGGLLNIVSVGSITATGSVSANSIDLIGATSSLDVTGDLSLTGNLLRNSTATITANTISLLGANALLSSQGSVTTLSGNGIRLPGAGSSVQIAGSALGGAISAGSVGIGGNAVISTGFLQPYGIEADSITVGGFVNSLNAVFFGPRTFVGGSPAPFTFSLDRFATQPSIFMPEVRANGQDTTVTGGNAGNGGSLGLTLTGSAGLIVGGPMPDVLAVTARGGDLPDVPTAGGNGGQITIISAGPVNVAAGGVVSATTGLLSYAGPDAWGTGGSITINAPTFSSIGSVVASQEEAVNSFYRASLNGGQISINASATSGVGITLGSGSFLLADRAALAGGTGGSISLTSNGSDISVDISGFISVNGGSLTIQTYRPGNPVAGNLSFFGSGFQFVSTASSITLRAASLGYGGDTNLLPAGTALTIAVGTMNSAASFFTDGSAPFALTATGDVNVGGNLGVQTFGSTSTVTLGLGNLSVTSQLRADTITSTGGTISARMIEARTISGFVVEATEGLFKVDTLTASSLASVNNGAFTYSTAGIGHVWNLGAIRGTGAFADLDFRGLDGASSLPDGLRGETLTLTLGSTLLVDDPSATQGLSSINFDGGNAATSAGQAGDGGNFTATVNNDFKVAAGRTVSATTGQIQPGGPATSGRGGTVDVTATGNIEIAGTIQVSSDEPATPPRRRSNQGGNIRLTSSRGGSTPQTSIKIESTAQLNALLNAAATGPGGRVTIVATGTNARVQMDGRARADRGTVEIRSNGTGGSVTTSASTDVRGDIVKIGALGNNGILTIGGGTFSADTTLQLYATGSNGQVQFTGNTTLQGNSLKYIAGQTVTVNNSVQVNIQGTTPVQIFTNVPNYSGSGGNGSTTGTFTGQGGVTNPLGGQPGF